MDFRHPALFLLLLLLPLLWILGRRGGSSAALRFSTVPMVKAFGPSWRVGVSPVLSLLRNATLALFIFALARPQAVNREREYETKGVDIMLSLDISGSMLAEDFKPENRMLVAKQEAKKFIRGRENDRIGLVVFARDAFTQCPLTLDYDILSYLVDEIQIGMIPDGTAIGMGIATAVNRLRESDAKSKVIILITDGENNAGKIDPVTAAELARTFGIKIYTIGVGRGGLVPFPINDPLFGKRYVQAKVDVDEFVLKRIADITSGVFFRARDPQSLTEVYARINELEKTEVKVKEYESYDELFHYFLVAGVLLLAAEVLLRNSVFLKLP
jgi:Ca-activated chloride channel family protein